MEKETISDIIHLTLAYVGCFLLLGMHILWVKAYHGDTFAGESADLAYWTIMGIGILMYFFFIFYGAKNGS
jgi:hypothetical protein